MIGIICAMKIEADAIIATVENKKITSVSGIDFVSGKIGETDVVIAVCGVGKVFAAVCAEAMIMKFSPEIIINSGVAGSLSPDIKIGDIVIAKDVVQHDMDTSPLGDPKGLLSGINIINIPCDEKVCTFLKSACDELSVRSFSGTVATGDQFMSDNAKKAEIAEHFSALACEMEGGSIGHVCYVNGVSFAILRAISDNADDGAEQTYEAFVESSSKVTHSVIDKFVRNFK